VSNVFEQNLTFQVLNMK